MAPDVHPIGQSDPDPATEEGDEQMYLDDVTTVITLTRDYGVPADTAYAMRERATTDTTANGPDNLVLLAWPTPAGDSRYAIARYRYATNPKGVPA